MVVWALDRLARSLKQLLMIAEECRLLGVDLVSLKQNVDTTLPAGRLDVSSPGRPNLKENYCGRESNQEWLRLGDQENMLGDLPGVSFILATLRK